MSDIIDSDGLVPPPGCAPVMAAPNGDNRSMLHMLSSISAGGKPGKPGKGGVELVVSVMLVASVPEDKWVRAAARGDSIIPCGA
jgi:hypothetical protein